MIVVAFCSYLVFGWVCSKVVVVSMLLHGSWRFVSSDINCVYFVMNLYIPGEYSLVLYPIPSFSSEELGYNHVPTSSPHVTAPRTRR